MELKSKKSKKCKQCKEVFIPMRPLQFICSPKCATQYSNIHAKTLAKEKAKEEKKALTENLTNWSQKLVVKIQEIARLIDHGQPCLARGVMANQFHGGHVFSRGSNPQIKYNLHNIHRQSAQSNHYQNDDGLLREGIVKEYGTEYMDFISGLRNLQSIKYKNEDYLEFYKLACKIAARLKKDLKVLDRDSRLILRSQVNLSLGIYPEDYCVYSGN